MVPANSLDCLIQTITAQLTDVQTLHSELFTQHALRLTIKKVVARCRQEGAGFLTKALPRLGKALDKALADGEPLNATKLGFEPQQGSQLPKFLGELFNVVLHCNGSVLPDADVKSVISLRQLCYCFYKYELPYDTEVEQGVLNKFIKTEEDVETYSKEFLRISEGLNDNIDARDYLAIKPEWISPVICGARKLLYKLFASFDRRNIFPRHGPGAVAEKLHPWDKFTWKILPDRLTTEFPIDEYFVSSMGHVVDDYRLFESIEGGEPYARVCLVPKDSRGPRIISCEPTGFQWIQQGLRDAIYRLVESHPLTCEEVRFTDQQPNQFGALMGSKYGRYATLDLNEASDRVSVGLVHLLFPGQVLPALLAARSLGTQLPDGRKVVLHKYAPMGSALCFPVLALTVWALLKAGLATCDAGGQPTVYVYGDDVIVDTENSEHAMNILEAFGLKVNRDKSCTSGFFRESCGMDAFKGVCVTPVRFRTVWSNHHCPSTYVSWIAYANSMYDRRFFTCYKLIVGWLESIYGYIPAREYIPGIKPSKACTLSAPSLRENTGMKKPRARRWNPHLQKWETLVWDVVPVTCTRKINGWSMLLRFFSEACSSYESGRAHNKADSEVRPHGPINGAEFQSSEYTLRKRNKLRLCWR